MVTFTVNGEPFTIPVLIGPPGEDNAYTITKKGNVCLWELMSPHYGIHNCEQQATQVPGNMPFQLLEKEPTPNWLDFDT